MQFQGTKDFLFKIQKNLKTDNSTIKSSILEDRKNVLDLNILVGVDVSGSISKQQFNQFMEQLDLIRGLSVVKVIEIDTEIVAMYDYFKINTSRIMRLRGGGGTEFTPFFEVSKQMNPDAILFFTDGDVFDRVKDPKIPTGWILTARGKKPYGFGEVVLELPA